MYRGERFNSISHLVGASLALVGGAVGAPAAHLEPTGVALAAARRLGCVAIHLGVGGATRAMLAAVREAGMAAGVFTVNEPARATRLWRAGADYLFTDTPARLASN